MAHHHQRCFARGPRPVLNVISLFHGAVPLIAIQMQALRLPEGVTLVFTTVLDELLRGPVDEDEEIRPKRPLGAQNERVARFTEFPAARFLSNVGHSFLMWRSQRDADDQRTRN